MDKRFILGNYYVTRVKDASPIDFDKAMKYSDNIYFAQQALKMGKDQYVKEFKSTDFMKNYQSNTNFLFQSLQKMG